MSLVYWPDPILSKRSEEVTDFTNIKDLVDFMFTVMYDNNGLGLSAVQIGELKRIFVMDVPNAGKKKNERIKKVIINPEIVRIVDEKIPHIEGCLSFPGVEVEVERSIGVELKYVDLQGNPQEEFFGSLAAICVQHEVEHLDGTNFLRYIGYTKRKLVESSLRRRYGQDKSG